MRRNEITGMIPWAMAVAALVALWQVADGWIALLLAMAAVAVSTALLAGTVFDVTVAKAPVRPPRAQRPDRTNDSPHSGPRPWAA